jgi:hypothetical protein
MRGVCVITAMLLVGCSQPESGNSQTNAVEHTAVAVAVADVTRTEPPLAKEPDVAAPEVNEGHCGMEECSYSQELRRSVIGGGANGRLVKLTLLGGTSARSGSAIKWNRSPHDVYVYCSTVLPSVMLETDGNWQVDVLDFVNGVPGILESAQATYTETCHKGDRQFPDDAKSLGYQEISEDKQDISVTKPEDIFALSETN